ncbi:MAG: hypothetical protein GW906_11590 [Epsilonproteobacteria bacterium]|nr:hypothetical protein [Campylobacterota bacterium]OIO13824.1 MAG: hypothetical protein AUJ81_10635 [Helicobacteraceae bacterium CG1_02_36_14]PIP11473.1 MAG: hypothetical protein COX50_00365 [Sulfurimonas sp. CG23_combo_of_CG06-09_8_20_14_all_36_33]PIS25092.1 MAG: hypothetical protein COT46_07085 [Sulfurimonas sp. CG08_land_8_20_14_0_20_36_33]PIU34633.1 MAG: hypothetical protein COT05_06700 [Sulfurimonas sp. CG07_land_8_20_14_0_80_36_56]PIV04121.1 MAG: hypothetical protein COS56_05730 [Sulfur
MKTLSTFTDANWSFSDRATSSENIWDMDETNTTNNGYPFLAWENGADINVTLNQAPTFTTTLSTITINEDSGIISYEINATDADNNDLNITVDSNNTSIITVSPSWSGNHVAPYTSPLDFNLTTVNNAYGSVQITLSVNDGTATTSTTYDINVTSVNDVPILSGTFAGTATEDVGTQSSGTITIVDVDSGESAFQALNITGTYGKFVLATNGNWTYDVNSSLASVQGLAGGSIGVDNFTVTSADGNVSQTFSVSVNGVNDAPTIDTLFSNRTILEDSGITNYELNVSDVDGNDLNIIVESNNTSILTVTPNWTNSLNQATWTQTQDFNLTTVLNGNGIVRITVTVNDGILNAVSNFDVNVTAVNDAPSLGYISDRVYYKNFTDKNITLEETDVDGQTLTYSVNILTANILNSITFTGNTMTISSSPEVSGYTDVNITVTDGDFNASKLFNVQVLSIAADSDITEEAGVTVETTDANGTTLSNTIGTDIIIERREENNGRVSHKIKVGTKTTEASSDINGSVVQITATGIQTKYTDTSIVAQADATVTGQASHTLTVNGVSTKAISEAIGAYTAISKDSNGAVEIVTSIDINGESISVIAKEDGTAEHSVSVNGITSKAISKVAGTTTTIKADGEVETKTPTTQASETIGGDVWIYETGTITDTTGKTVTRFQKRNTTTGAITSVQNTFAPETPYNAGSTVVIEEINSHTVIKTTFSLTTDMTVE